MDFLTLAKGRYSCRMLDPRPVEQEKHSPLISSARRLLFS